MLCLVLISYNPRKGEIILLKFASFFPVNFQPCYSPSPLAGELSVRLRVDLWLDRLENVDAAINSVDGSNHSALLYFDGFMRRGQYRSQDDRCTCDQIPSLICLLFLDHFQTSHSNP